MTEPSLETLKDEAIEQAIEENSKEEKIEPAKIKTFRVDGYLQYDGMRGINNRYDGRAELENQMNEFLSKIDNWYLESVNIQVVKNFLPGTTRGEYEEIWVGTIVYHDPQ